MPRALSQRERQRQEARWLDFARELLGATEVRLHHVPNWLRRAILKVVPTPARGCTTGHACLDRALHHTGDRGWCDHYGSTTLAGKLVFVSEPYLSLGDLDAARRFADLLGVELSISPLSWWYPSSTTRLILWPPEGRR